MLRATRSTKLNRSQHQRISRTRLGLETLETRRLLAGDVTAEVVDGNLLLRGDQESNQIELRAARDGTAAIEIVGLTDDDGNLTTINGAPSLSVTGVSGDVTANMRRGDDVIYIHDLDLPGNLQVRGGAGNDKVLIGGMPRDGGVIVDPLPEDAVDEAIVDGDLAAPGDLVEPVDPVPILPLANVTIAGQARIDTGAGNDAIAVGSVNAYGDLTIHTGRHDDIVRLGVNELLLPTDDTPDDGSALGDDGPPISLPLDVFGSLRVSTGRGADQAWLESVHVGENMRVNLGGGDDLLSFDWGGVGGDLVVNGGAGNDIIALAHVTADRIRINAAGGHDAVGLAGVAARRIDVRLGAGNDVLLVSDTTADIARFHGGGGFDVLWLGGVNQFGQLQALKFEWII